MRHYLIVGNQTLSAETLVAKIGECLAAGPCQFQLVVPATHVADHLVWTEGHDRAVAHHRLDEALVRFRSLGADIDGEVGDATAMDAVRDAFRWAGPFDEVIVSTLPLGVSRWLRQDLPHRIERTFEVPVTVLAASVVATPVA